MTTERRRNPSIELLEAHHVDNLVEALRTLNLTVTRLEGVLRKQHEAAVQSLALLREAVNAAKPAPTPDEQETDPWINPPEPP